MTLAFFLVALAPEAVQGQQLPQYTQYFFNDYAVNPAVAGSEDKLEATSNNRFQWVGITDAPRTYTLTMNGPVKKNKMGLGGKLFTDITGPTRRTGFEASYAYHFRLNPSVKLSMALSGGALQYTIDHTKIDMEDPSDQVIGKGTRSVVEPNATFGFYLYGENFYVGGVAPQLLQNKIQVFKGQERSRSVLEDHYLLTAGYRLDVLRNIAFEPSVMGKYVFPTPPVLDLGGRFLYKDQIWVGGSYRSSGSFSGLVGFTLKNNLTFGYSIDVATDSELRDHSNGTHELMIGIRFGAPAKSNGSNTEKESSKRGTENSERDE